ncbi:hypothetical protein GC101_28480 [Paenibacillus sp. LMG 31459]|uniref:Uncharacterized protein n=1 Tax=Paenibacillus phytohabitans TaxID=2654978 RepID=A0ABX1YSS2_9BACL|nr:hypothetical protein [Paenibacillus phytohabitans]NOU82805.1 hypothetical protein [Paenibacillus phytohabitans]
MKIAVYTGITGMGKRFECYTTLEEIEGDDNKDRARRIISSLKRTGACVLPIKGSIEAVYYKAVPES